MAARRLSPAEYSTIQRKKGKLALTFQHELSSIMKDAATQGKGTYQYDGTIAGYKYNTCYQQFHSAIKVVGAESYVSAHTGERKDGTKSCWISITIK
jgi:hypothetical protein